MPKILAKTLNCKSRFFEVYDLKLQFDNGVVIDYEVLYDETVWTVMIVPIDSNGDVLLVREYFAAIDEYKLSLPKGGLNYVGDDLTRTSMEAANDELQEEVGYKSNNLVSLGKYTNSAGSINKATEIFLARDLVPSKKEGDEPEELEIVRYQFAKFEELLEKETMIDARMVTAYYLTQKYLNKEKG